MYSTILTGYYCAIPRQCYIKVSESAQNRDVSLGEADSETLPKRSLRRNLFKTCCMNWGEVNLTHAYYNGSRRSKDTEDPSWSTSFKTRRTQKTSSALEDFICVVFVPDRNIELLDDGFMVVVVLDGGEGEGRKEKIILTVCFRSA
ncbi:hypothetical protein Tco_0664672 [Tanacetum coccineum]